MWRLVVEENFAAAHALRHYKGKCERVHGHNFNVSMTVEGNKLEGQCEILIDFKILKNLLKKALEQVDHSFLNEKEPFDAINPSSENLAKYIWSLVAQALKNCPEAHAVSLYSISVSEKPGQTAIYLGQEMN